MPDQSVSTIETPATTSGGRTPELVIFDFDGTLADTWAWFRDQLAAGAETIGYRKTSAAKIEGLRGRGTEAVLKELGITGAMLPMLAAHMMRQAEGASASFKLFDGIPDLLEQLTGSGVALAVVSSNSERVVRDVLGSRLEALVSTGRFGAAVFDKASAFRSIVDETGRDPAGTIAIGDETRDFDAAMAAGVQGIAVEWGFADAELLRSIAPGSTAPDVDALRSILLGDVQKLRN